MWLNTRFKNIFQRDSMDCGIACLRMICRHYGCYLSETQADSLCFATAQGVSLMALKEASESLGFKTVCGKITLERLSSASLPCVLFWNQNHFVVLYHCNNRFFYIADPSKGKIKLSKEEIKKHWLCDSTGKEDKGIAMFFEPTETFVATKKSKKEERTSFKFLWNYIHRYRRHFLLIMAILLTGCILQLIMPFLTQWIVDVGIKHADIHFIWLVLLGELMIVFGKTVSDFIRRWLLMHISMRINISLISDFFIKLLKLPMVFFDTKLMGDLLQRMNDHARVQSFLTNQVMNVLFSFFSFLIFGIALLIFDKIIFIIFALGSIVYGGWIATFLSKRKVLDYELFEQQSKNNDKTYQFVTTMQEIKLQDCERRRRWEWEDTQSDLFSVQMKVLKLQQTQEAGSIFINEIKNILITVFAATAVIEGQMTLGAMLAVQYIIGQLNSPVDQLMGFVYSLQDVKISLERINEIHEGRNEEDGDNQVSSFGTDKTITLSEVDFKYDPHSSKKTIDGISINIPEGKVTAIVGASGSGKTTLIKLMLGYYRVLKGEIVVAGHELNRYNLKWWRKHCGVVLQDGVIFSESIERNIAVDDSEVDRFLLEEAAKIANIHDYIMGLPLKYDTKIGRDGIGLSQGQKQRILIARAVYKNPDFIFLDEATNALDAKNERAIVENLDEFYKGRTVVVVAHRLSTVKGADQIIVLDEGKVVEFGNHASLIEKKGAYFNLVKNQLELGN